MIPLKKAVDFHGHLGPYLVLGVLMGDVAIKKLKCRRHFGIRAQVKGADAKPKSCLIDGIQISTGCTYGKGNIRKIKGDKIQAIFCDLKKNKKLKVSLRQDLLKKLDNLDGHRESEIFAKKLLKYSAMQLFCLTEE